MSKTNEKNNKIERQLIELCDLFSFRFNTNYAIYEGEDHFDDIKKTINNNIEELLIVQKGSRMLTDQLFRKFVVNELVYEGKTPLIILP